MAMSLHARDSRPEGHGPQRFRRQAGRLFRRRRPRRRVRLEDVPRHAVELEGPQLFRAPAGPAVHQGQGRGDPGRLRVGHHLQRQRRHGPLRRRMPTAYSPWAIFVRPDSKIRKPEDLKDVPISVGMRAGSHFNVPYRLEKYLPLENIKTVNTGGFGARLKALLDGEVEAASLLPPQIAMAEQLGLRKIIEDTLPHVVVGAGGRRRRRSCARLSARARPRREGDGRRSRRNICRCGSSRCRPEFENYHNWDFSKFGRGERFVYQPHPARGIRRGARSGQALGPRPISQGPQLR